MTSNVGSQYIAGLSGRDADYDEMRRQVMDALRLQFRPEFLNRIDEVIVFHALTEADLTAIVDLLLADLQRRLAGQDITLELTPAARRLIAREGTDPTYGARPLKRTIQRLVENPFARALLQGQFKPGDFVTADADPISGTLVFKVDDRTVVTEGGGRRDARSAAGREPTAAGTAGRKGRTSAFDLPSSEPRKDGDGGELVN
jgi:ATP-dependent Clp protease ATP-binding subunit ClpA